MNQPGPLRALIAYKAIKGVVQLIVGLVFGVALALGEGEHLRSLAVALREYVTARLAIEVAEVALSLTTPNHLGLITAALMFDGALGLVESRLLHTGRRWALWMVVVFTSLLVPWEIFEIVRHVRITRVVLLIANLAAIAYVSWQARKHHSAMGPQNDSVPAEAPDDQHGDGAP